MITTITLNPAIDCIIKVKKLQPGTLNRAVEEAVFPGERVSMCLWYCLNWVWIPVAVDSWQELPERLMKPCWKNGG